MVEARRQASAVRYLDLEGHAVLALDAVFAAAGEEVVGSFDGQRHGDCQRLAELLAAAAVLERVVVRRVIEVAVLVSRLVVGLDHRLVRVGLENWKIKSEKNIR